MTRYDGKIYTPGQSPNDPESRKKNHNYDEIKSALYQTSCKLCGNMLVIIGNNISQINECTAFPSRRKQRYPHSKMSHLNETVSKSNYNMRTLGHVSMVINTANLNASLFYLLNRTINKNDYKCSSIKGKTPAGYFYYFLEIVHSE